jgi:hypothetical protein
MEVDDADIVKLRGPRDERVEEDRRGGRRAVEIDLRATVNSGDGFGRGDDLHGDQCE